MKFHIQGLKQKLYKFQQHGVAFIEKNDGRCLIADEMGLGKTIQALAWLQLRKEVRPAIVVCPATIKLKWFREIGAWMDGGETPVLLQGETSETLATGLNEEIFIINYDIVIEWLDELVQLKPKGLVFDECQYIKNQPALRSKASMYLSKGVPHIIGLSGTPIKSRPYEIYNIVHIIKRRLFPSFWKFVQRYCDAKMSHGRWDYTGAKHTKELHKILTGSIMLRRRRKDVMKELPEKTRIVIPLEISNRKNYEKAKTNFVSWLKTINPKAAIRASKAETLTKIETLKQLSIAGKFKACKEWIQDFIDTGEKLIIICDHTHVIKALSKHFGKKGVELYGGTSPKQKTKNIDRFNSDRDCLLCFANLEVLLGLDLHHQCNNTCTIELGWVFTDHEQGEDRVVRIGQKAKFIGAYYLIAERTIEEDIMELLDNKQSIFAGVIDGEEVKEGVLLRELLDKFHFKKRWD